ncbi:hypothetical protein KCX70_23040 (plasmid) [Stutzerimonas stutzeri]|uniref:hypothetical protein n=1 Tax=Stutzerimonas stutzeri TaxID=316 RepID=UPI001BAF9587|nr:hypothetical protein [Stutzerimonas stutzeri]QUE78367.1 hypothetical protein KCX70_23040 [Stutzerimonas stutzeri]
MIDVFIRANTAVADIAKALSGFDCNRVQIRNGGPTEIWQRTAEGWVKDQPGMTLYEDLSANYIELYGYVTQCGLTEPINAPSLRLSGGEAEEWLMSMERHRYLVEDGIGCSVNADVDGRIIKCAVVTFALSEFKQRAIKPGTELNDRILLWADDMLRAGADAIDVCIAKRN